MSSQGFTLEHGGWLHILPVCHYRVEFAGLVRDAVQTLGPAVVAVELPASLRNQVLRGVARLPELSVVMCPVGADGMVYLTVEPIDPMVEALRSASECGVPVAFVDLDVEEYGEYRDAVPDAYAVWRVGLEAFYQAYRRFPRPQDPLDQRREAAMAYHLQRLHQEHGGPVLLVCGMAHADGVRETAVHGDFVEQRADRVVRKPDIIYRHLDQTAVREQELRVRRERVPREGDVVESDAQVRVRQPVELDPRVLDRGCG